jgi:hypothetical protein
MVICPGMWIGKNVYYRRVLLLRVIGTVGREVVGAGTGT